MLRLAVGVSIGVLVFVQRDLPHGPAWLQEWALVGALPSIAAIGFMLSGVLGRWPAWMLMFGYLAYVGQAVLEAMAPASVVRDLGPALVLEPLLVLVMAYGGLVPQLYGSIWGRGRERPAYRRMYRR